MFDIHFFQNMQKVKKDIVSGVLTHKDSIKMAFDEALSKSPNVFNVETTNACNMKCIMCPRTNKMIRSIQHMDMALFEKIIKQIIPYTKEELDPFHAFVQDAYSIFPQMKNENAFYFYTVAHSLTLHGYGEPLLDPYIVGRVALCTKYGIPTYFSCVPANIDVPTIIDLMQAGLGTIKFSIDALSDKGQKRIRGEMNDFTISYKKIKDLLAFKRGHPEINTKIVVTMIALGDDEAHKREQEKFMSLWDADVFAYVKSQDNRWHYEEDNEMACNSHYEEQYCEYPWTSLTVMVDGSVVPCTQDYNCEMTFGNAKEESLKDIWGSAAYQAFRRWHVTGEFPKNHKCMYRCDQKLVCERLRHETSL